MTDQPFTLVHLEQAFAALPQAERDVLLAGIDTDRDYPAMARELGITTEQARERFADAFIAWLRAIRALADRE